jgi:enamine deaminase RidA (YjgF/YER057c/UK114 family)
MNELLNPNALAAPAAAYSHAVLSTAVTRILNTSGVVPTSADGSVPEGIEAQVAQVWRNLEVIMAEAGFVTADVVSLVTYVVAGQDLAPVMAARDRAMDGHRPASTLLTVSGLARPQWLVEITLVAMA